MVLLFIGYAACVSGVSLLVISTLFAKFFLL